jgi:hypothetical protein
MHRAAVDFAIPSPGSLSVGDPQVLSAQVNPMHPSSASAANGVIAVTFARRGEEGSVLYLDPNSLEARSSTDYVYARGVTAPTMNVQRVGLADGGAVLFWTEGSVEWGHRAMAQSFGAEGAPRSAPVVLSPARMDVFGTPQAATIDGHHVVATLSATEGKAFELVAVPVEAL